MTDEAKHEFSELESLSVRVVVKARDMNFLHVNMASGNSHLTILLSFFQKVATSWIPE